MMSKVLAPNERILVRLAFFLTGNVLGSSHPKAKKFQPRRIG